MQITRQRFIDLHKYLFAVSAAIYVGGIFGTRVLQQGMIAALGICILSLFFIDALTARLRLAALMWLVPLLITGLQWRTPMTPRADAPFAAYGLISLMAVPGCGSGDVCGGCSWKYTSDPAIWVRSELKNAVRYLHV